VSNLRDKGRQMGLTPRQRHCWLEDRAGVVRQTASRARRDADAAFDGALERVQDDLAAESATVSEAHAAEVSALRREILELEIQHKTLERSLALARMHQAGGDGGSNDGVGGSLLTGLPEEMGTQMLSSMDQQRVGKLMEQFIRSEEQAVKIADKIKKELRETEKEGFILKGKTGVWRYVRDGENFSRGNAFSIDVVSGRRCVRVRKNTVTAAATRPVRNSAPLIEEYESELELEKRALVARRQMIDAMLAEDLADEIAAIDGQIAHLKARRYALADSLAEGGAGEVDDGAGASGAPNAATKKVAKFSQSEHDDRIAKRVEQAYHTDGIDKMSPSLQLRYSEGFHSVYAALVAMIKRGCEQTIAGVAAAGTAQICCKEVRLSQSSIIIQPWGNPAGVVAERMSAYRLALAGFLARSVKMCSLIILCAVADTAAASRPSGGGGGGGGGGGDARYNCWTEVDLICEVLQLAGAEAVGRSKQDQGDHFLYRWHFKRGDGDGARKHVELCVVELRVFKKVQHAARLVSGLVPGRNHSAAPDLCTVCCVSSPPHYVDDLQTNVRAAMVAVEQKAAQLGWMDEDTQDAWSEFEAARSKVQLQQGAAAT
jgi:hypothetical protein